MAKRADLVNEMERILDAHSIYIGAMNGELLKDLTIGQIFKAEQSYGRSQWRNDFARDLAYIAKLVKNGVDLNDDNTSQAGDCSGIIVGALRTLGLIKPTADYRARDLQTNLTTKIPLGEAQPGDLVFDKKSEATHVGIVVEDGCVIESKGRDDGVVKLPLKSRPWASAGSFSWWEDEQGNKAHVNRILKYTKGNIMIGADVRIVQEALIKRGYDCGRMGADGEFGQLTKSAVMSFQADNGLSVDGIVGEETLKSLGLK